MGSKGLAPAVTAAVLIFDRSSILGTPFIPGFVRGSDPIARLGSKGLPPAVTAASDMVREQALFFLAVAYFLVLL